MDFTTNFKTELNQAQQFEQRTKEIYESLGFTVEIMPDNSPERKFWDLKITKNNKSQFIEVKYDQMAAIGRDDKSPTGNLYFEFESRGQKSGLETTKADLLIYWISPKFYIIFNNIPRLKRELRNLPLVSGGDENSSYGKLLSLKSLPNYLGAYDDVEKCYQVVIL